MCAILRSWSRVGHLGLGQVVGAGGAAAPVGLVQLDHAEAGDLGQQRARLPCGSSGRAPRDRGRGRSRSRASAAADRAAARARGTRRRRSTVAREGRGARAPRRDRRPAACRRPSCGRRSPRCSRRPRSTPRGLERLDGALGQRRARARARRRARGARRSSPGARGASTSTPFRASTRAVARFCGPKTTCWTQPVSRPDPSAPRRPRPA